MSAAPGSFRLPLPLEILLIFIPVTVALHYLAHDRHVWVFASASLAILPLAAYIGRATEVLASRFGGGIGGLMNATFGRPSGLPAVARCRERPTTGRTPHRTSVPDARIDFAPKAPALALAAACRRPS